MHRKHTEKKDKKEKVEAGRKPVETGLKPAETGRKSHEQHKEKKHHVPAEEKEIIQHSPRLFKAAEGDNRGINQEININLNVNEAKDDSLAGCFSGLAKCFGK